MSFVANYNGERVVSLYFSTDDWLSLKANYREHALYCNDPDCRSPMIPKTYRSTGTQFFAHKSENVSCLYGGGGESREHLYLKEIIFHTARDLGFSPDFEVFRYGKTFDELKSDDLKDIVDTIGHFHAEGILKWLYPKHVSYKRYRMSPQGRRACKYTRDLCYSQKVKTVPNCSCDNKHHTVGAFNTFKQENGDFAVYLFCNRCGTRSANMISKRKLTCSELKEAFEWERGVVNYTKTDFKPWG